MNPTTFRLPLRLLLHLAAGLVTIAGLNACRTTQGLGSDIKHLGGHIEREAAQH